TAQCADIRGRGFAILNNRFSDCDRSCASYRFYTSYRSYTNGGQVMKLSRRSLIAGIPLVLFLSSFSASGQWDKKPVTEWTEKDAIKILNDSPWGRTQTYTDDKVQYRGPTTGRQGTQNPNQTTNLPPNALHLNFRIRFLSSKPIRQALTRVMELKAKGGVQGE